MAASYKKGSTGDTWNFQGKLYINEAAATMGALKMHSHQMAASTDDSPNQYANEFKGEFLATTGTMDGIASHYHMAASGTGVMRSILGVAYLDTGLTLSGATTATSWINGVLGSVSISGVLDGAGVTVTGTYGGLGTMAGATLTECAYMSALWADSQATQVPTTGASQLLLLTNSGSATLDSAINVVGAAKITSLFTFDAVAGFITATPITGGTTEYINCKIGTTVYQLTLTCAS